MSKVKQVVEFISTLPIGERISVRGLARKLALSEGTVYRAFKEAENIGIVATIERVGTIRTEKKKPVAEMLTYEEIVRIIDGQVIGGKQGLNQHLNKFIIGAMKEEAMLKYFDKHSLIIVGNREGAQELALRNDVAVLITGGFQPSKSVIQLADELGLPLISCDHDTFTVATLINKSIINQEIKKEILTVNDIYTPLSQTVALQSNDTVAKFKQLAKQTGLSRFPVINQERLVGILTAKDIIGKSEQMAIEKVMTKRLVTVNKQTSVASVSYKMVWEDIEMIPVVEEHFVLAGVVSRQDVMKAMHLIQQQPQINNTFEDEIMMNMVDYSTFSHDPLYDYQVEIQPRMINQSGTISYGVLCELVTTAVSKKIQENIQKNHLIEKIDLHYFSHIQIDNFVQIKVDIFNQSRKQALVQVDLYNQNTLAAKGIITCQIIEGE